MAITILRDKSSLNHYLQGVRADGKTIALVPTMGWLHEGHMSIVQEAKKRADVVIATIFVNPMQFGPREDFATYPRDEAGDVQKLQNVGADAVYLPRAEDMYLQGFSTVVYVKGLGEDLCGSVRPGHFDGVCTVVTKLLLQILPNIALFGEKDYQQFHIISRMVRDLDIPVTILSCPTIREPDGLAMSSRNSYLSESERKVAPLLHRIMTKVSHRVLENPRDIETGLEWGEQQLLQAGFSKVDYLTLRDAESLQPVHAELVRPARLLAAAFLGRTRLIDNIPVLP